MIREPKVVGKLRGVAAKLTRDEELQRDLLQEMFLHLSRIQTKVPGCTVSWYVKSCEYHARNYLKRGRSVDSLKHAKNIVRFGELQQDRQQLPEPVDPQNVEAELAAKDIIHQVMVRLAGRQRDIFYLLLEGRGVREIGRQMRMTHPAVIKHRRRIAQVAQRLIGERSGREVANDATCQAGEV